MSETKLVPCPSCGATNRIPRAEVEQGLKPVCGRCKSPLAVSFEAVVTVTDTNFAAEVEASPLPVVLDLWAPWCQPCRMLAPVLEDLAGELAGRVRFAKLNVDQNPKTAARFRVGGIPLLVVLQDGQEVDRLVGLRPRGEILRWLERFVGG